MKKLLSLVCCAITLSCWAQDSTRAKQRHYLGILTLTEKYTIQTNWTPTDQGIVGEHFKRLVKMKEEGIVLLAGRTSYELNNPDMMGLVIFTATGDEAALQFMMEDPAVKNNIMKAKVHPYGVAVSKCE